MANGLLGLIARPQIADIQGGFIQGRQEAQQQQEFQRQQQARGLAGAALQQQFGGQLGELAAVDPQAALNLFEATGVVGESRQKQFAEDVRVASGLSANPQQTLSFLDQAIARNQQRGIPSPQIQQFRDEFAQDPVRGAQTLQQLSTVLQQGLQPTASAGEREFQALIANLPPEQQALAKRIKVGLDPRAVGSAGQTISELGTAEQVAQVESILAGGKEKGKLKAQLKFKPVIQRAVKIAEEEAKAEGEAFTDLKRSKAALPGLVATVDSLKELALIATSTVGGKLFDSAARELGFGGTKGATARAKFIAVVANQVLPLLKPTFGAAFTVQEGESLKATMGDPDASPAEKIAQLEAFITQKQRSIETSQREVQAITGQATDQTDDEIRQQLGL